MFNTYKKPPIVKVGHFSLKALTKNSSKKDLQSYQRAKINYRFIKKIPGKREYQQNNEKIYESNVCD